MNSVSSECYDKIENRRIHTGRRWLKSNYCLRYQSDNPNDFTWEWWIYTQFQFIFFCTFLHSLTLSLSLYFSLSHSSSNWGLDSLIDLIDLIDWLIDHALPPWIEEPPICPYSVICTLSAISLIIPSRYMRSMNFIEIGSWSSLSFSKWIHFLFFHIHIFTCEYSDIQSAHYYIFFVEC
jgi:hypothetical protein